MESGRYYYTTSLTYTIQNVVDVFPTERSPTITVIKDDVPADNPGFHEDYEIRRGDLNNDGRLDLYIRSKPGNPAPVSDFVLRQTASKDFALITTLSSSLRSQAQGWPLANIELTTGDFNVDGAADVLLEGVGTLISGAFDQLVFAPRAANSPPLVVTALDQQVQKFFAEVGNALYDPDYFENYAPTVTQQQVIHDWWFGGEYCSNVPELEPYGSWEFWPPVPAWYFDSYDDFLLAQAKFLADKCYDQGLDIIHYDWIEVFYTILVGSKDYSIYSQDAIEISRVLREILEEWSMPDGSDVKEQVRRVLESIFGYPVFGPSFDDDQELQVMFSNIGYLIEKSKGAAAVNLPECRQLTAVDHNAKKLFHNGKFTLNVDLTDNIIVTSDPNGVAGDKLIQINITFADIGFPAYATKVVKGAEKWNTCGKMSNGSTIRLVVNASVIPMNNSGNADVQILTLPKNHGNCSKAEAGFVPKDDKTKMYLCTQNLLPKDAVAMHEFGHTLGFGDMYNTDPESPSFGGTFLGYGEDIMSSIGWEVLPYHLDLLVEKYE